jgi:hypothetical protein
MATKGTKRQSPARRSSPRKAAPRKAATRADDAAAGESAATATATAVDAASSPEETVEQHTIGELAEKAATNGHGELDEKDKPDKAELNGYPKGTPLYCWEGPDGEIVLPHIATVVVDPVFFYDIYELPEMYQTFEWFKRAGVPHVTGRRVMALSYPQRRELLGGWFQGMKEKPPDPNLAGGVPGESSSSDSASGSTAEQ